MKYRQGETAVIVPVPAADLAVAAWRADCDTSAPYGVPAHITIVYPFVPLAELSEPDIYDLAALFITEPAFSLILNGFARFHGKGSDPDVLYLVPVPAAPFRRLIAALSERWPQALPYGGQFGDPVPHLTVTDTAPAELIDEAARRITGALPIVTSITRGCIIVFDGALWREHMSLPLGVSELVSPCQASST